MNKRGYIVSYGDWFKGFFIGLVVGAVVVYLFMSGIIKIPQILSFSNDQFKAVFFVLPTLLGKRLR